jgi:hypothetical protein
MGIFDPQPLPSNPTSQSTTSGSVASWAQPYVTNMLNNAQSLANQGTTDLQNQVYASSAGMGTPGQFAQGTGFLNQAGQGMLGTTGTALNYGQQGSQAGQTGMAYGQQGRDIGVAGGAQYGQQGAGYGQQASGAGQAYQKMATDPSSIQAYMNPYIQQSLAPQLELLNQQQLLGAQSINAKAAAAGAFGGNRGTLAQGLNAQNYALAGQQAIGQGYNEAFKQAQQAQQFGSDIGLRGLQTGIQGAQTGLQGVNTQLAGTAQGMQGAGLGIQGAQAGLQGVQGAQQGYAGATQAGVGLGNLGAQEGQYGLSKLALQNQIANQQYNLPYQRAQFMQGMLSGLPVSTSTTQGYAQQPNKGAQIIGGLGALGTYGKDIFNMGKTAYDAIGGGSSADYMDSIGAVSSGPYDEAMSGSDYLTNLYGTDIFGGGAAGGLPKDFRPVKRYAEGGITSINRRVMNNPTDYSEQTINRGAQNNVLGGVTKLLALDTIAKQKQAMQAQQQMQAQQAQPILAQLQQRAMQQAMPQQMAQGIDSAQSNLPQQYAGGGIIAFEEGGSVLKDLKDYYEKMKGRLSRASENTATIPSMPSLFGIPLFGAADKNAIANARAEAEAPLIDAKPDELGRYKAGTDTSGIIIHPSAPRVAGPSAPATPQIPTAPAYRPAETSGIDKLVKGYEDMIRGGDDFKQAESKAETNAMRKMFLNMMANKPGSSLVSAVGDSGLAAQEGLEKTQEAIQARKDKQITQLMGLGLKGEDLKNAARKMGIDEAELQAKIPVYNATVMKELGMAKYYGNRGSGSGAGGITAGTISAKDLAALDDKYAAIAANPKADPAFFSTLDKRVQDLLSAKPGSKSYNAGMEEVRRITEERKNQFIRRAQILGARKVPLSSAEEI